MLLLITACIWYYGGKNRTFFCTHQFSGFNRLWLSFSFSSIFNANFSIFRHVLSSFHSLRTYKICDFIWFSAAIFSTWTNIDFRFTVLYSLSFFHLVIWFLAAFFRLLWKMYFLIIVVDFDGYTLYKIFIPCVGCKTYA